MTNSWYHSCQLQRIEGRFFTEYKEVIFRGKACLERLWEMFRKWHMLQQEQ